MPPDDQLDPEQEQPAEEEAPKASPKKRQSGTPSSKRPASKRGAPSEDAKAPDEAAKNGGAPARAVAPSVPPRLLVRYREEVRPSLMREFGFPTPLRAPRVVKVVVNMGLGEALLNARALETATGQMASIAGQRPVVTKARKSVAAFKVREGQAIGSKVTLRGRRMYEFLDRFMSVALPRVRDFRGLPRSSFDGQGNFTVGLREQVMFPEIDYNQIDRIRGLEVTVTTTAWNDREGLRLLELLGMPFAREGQGN